MQHSSVGKRLHVINFMYTLLEKAYSYEDNHPIAIFRESERYDNSKNALEDVIAEIKQLSTVKVA